MARNLSGLQVNIGADASGLRKEIRSAQDSMNGLSDSAQKVAESFAAIQLSGAVDNMIGSLKQATKAAMDFESAMADVKKVVDFDGKKEFQGMSQEILKLSQRIPMAADGLAQIIAAGGQANIPKEELLEFAESAAKMGVAFDTTAEEAGTMMAKWRTAFGYGQKEVIALADQINYLGNTTAAGTAPISEVVTRIGALGGVSGVSSANIAALAASVAGTGQPAEVAATGIKNMMLALTSGEAATKSQQEAFASLGLSAVDVAQKMQTDAKGAILAVLTAISQLDKASQAATLKKLFGSESIGAISPLLTQLSTLEENFNKVADSTQYAGSMQGEFDERIKTTEAQLQLLENSISAIAINLGSVFLPAVAQVAQEATKIAGNLATWVDENRELISTLGQVATGLIAVKAAQKGLDLASGAIALARSYYAELVAQAAKEVSLAATKEAEITATQEAAIQKRIAAIERISIKEQQAAIKRINAQRLSTEQTIALITKETAAIEARYTAIATSVRTQMTAAYQAMAVASQEAGAATVSAQAKATTATEATTLATRALAEAQTAQGVAAAKAGAQTVTAQTEAAVATARTTAATTTLSTATAVAGAEAVATGTKAVGAMAVTITAVRGALTAVWALAGGWLGVAAAIAYAIYQLAQYGQAKAEAREANTYNGPNDSSYFYNEETGKWTKNSKRGINSYDIADAPAGLIAMEEALNTTEVTNPVELTNLNMRRRFRQMNDPERKAQLAQERAAKQLQEAESNIANLTVDAGSFPDAESNIANLTVDAGSFPDVDTSGIGGGGSGGGRSTKSEIDDISRKLAEGQRKSEELHSALRDAISESLDTSYALELARHQKDVAEKSKTIDEIEESGVDTEKVDSLRKELEEYESVIDDKIKKKWREAYEDMSLSAREARAEAEKNYTKLADIAYDATKTSLDRQRAEKEKELMKDEEDWETKATISEWYYAKLQQAEQALSDARRDAHEKHMQDLQEEGDYAGVIAYLNSDEGSQSQKATLKLEGQRKLAETYKEIWSIANRSVEDSFAEVASAAYDSLSEALQGFIEGTKSAQEVFEDFGKSVLSMIAKIAAQKLAAQWTSSIMSWFKFSSGGAVGEFATGGYITGAGTATSDSIPAMLSNGEYVIKAASVAKLGVPFLDKLNTAGDIAGFATGGYVSTPSMYHGSGIGYSASRGGSSGGVIVNITNKTDSSVKVEDSRYDEGFDSYILNVVVDGASRNKGGFATNLRTAIGG